MNVGIKKRLDGKWVVISVLLILSATLLRANPIIGTAVKQTITIAISNIDQDIEYMRYQLNNEETTAWNKISIQEPIFTYETELYTKDSIYLQQSYDGINWSESSRFMFDEHIQKWVLLAPQQEEKFRQNNRKQHMYLNFEVVSNIPIETYKEYYKVGIGGKGEFGNVFNNGITLGASIGYIYGFSNTDRVNHFHKIPLSGNIGYELFNNNRIAITPLISIGALFHILDGTVFADAIEDGIHLFVDFTSRTGIKLNIHLNEHISITTTPSVILFTQTKHLGLLGEISLGTTINLKGNN